MIKRLLRKHGDGEAAADDDDDDDDEPVEPKLTAKQRRMQKRSGHEPPKNVDEDDDTTFCTAFLSRVLRRKVHSSSRTGEEDHARARKTYFFILW